MTPAATSAEARESWRDLGVLTRLAAPLGLVQLGYHLTGLVDTAFAGRMGQVALAATGLGNALFYMVAGCGIGLAMGVDPLASQAFGAGRPEHARRVLWQGLYMSAVISVPLMLAVAALTWVLPWVGIEAGLAAETGSYVFARLPSLPLLVFCVVCRGYLQAAHRARPVVVATVVTNILNAAADGALGFGDEGLAAVGIGPIGLPALGVAGIGWSTSLAQFGQLVWMLIAVAWALPPGDRQHTPSDDPPGTHRRPRPRTMMRVFRLGLPVGLQLSAEIGVFALVGLLMGRLGALAMASHQVALSIASMTFSFCLGIGAATSVEVGRAVGAGNSQATRRRGWMGMGLGLAFMSASALVMALWPEMLARWVTIDSETIVAAGVLVQIAAVFQLVDGVQAVAAGALRGAGDTRYAFYATIAAHWGLGLPLGLVLADWFGMGPQGLWWGLTAGLGGVALALTLRFRRLTRHQVQPIEPFEMTPA